jgi:hypothetical protein
MRHNIRIFTYLGVLLCFGSTAQATVRDDMVPWTTGNDVSLAITGNTNLFTGGPVAPNHATAAITRPFDGGSIDKSAVSGGSNFEDQVRNIFVTLHNGTQIAATITNVRSSVALTGIGYSPVPGINPAWSVVGSILAAGLLILRHRATLRK